MAEIIVNCIIVLLLLLVFFLAFNTFLPASLFFKRLSKDNREALVALGALVVLLVVVYSGKFKSLRYGDIEARLLDLQKEIEQIYNSYITETFSQKENLVRVKFFQKDSQKFAQIRLNHKPIRNSILFWEGVLLFPPDSLREMNDTFVTFSTNFDSSSADWTLTVRYMQAPS